MVMTGKAPKNSPVVETLLMIGNFEGNQLSFLVAELGARVTGVVLVEPTVRECTRDQ